MKQSRVHCNLYYCISHSNSTVTWKRNKRKPLSSTVHVNDNVTHLIRSERLPCKHFFIVWQQLLYTFMSTKTKLPATQTPEPSVKKLRKDKDPPLDDLVQASAATRSHTPLTAPTSSFQTESSTNMHQGIQIGCFGKDNRQIPTIGGTFQIIVS